MKRLRWLKPSAFAVGDVVHHIDDHARVGVVTEIGKRTIDVVFADGCRASGGGLLAVMRKVRPRVALPPRPGWYARRGWNREQSVRASFARAGIALAEPEARP